MKLKPTRHIVGDFELKKTTIFYRNITASTTTAFTTATTTSIANPIALCC